MEWWLILLIIVGALLSLEATVINVMALYYFFWGVANRRRYERELKEIQDDD